MTIEHMLKDAARNARHIESWLRSAGRTANNTAALAKEAEGALQRLRDRRASVARFTPIHITDTKRNA